VVDYSRVSVRPFEKNGASNRVKHNFYLHIKECEFRYNYRNKKIVLNVI